MLARLVKLVISLVVLASFMAVFNLLSLPILILVLVFFIMRRVRRNRINNEYALPKTRFYPNK